MIEHQALELLQNTAVRANGVVSLHLFARPTVAVPDGVKLVDVEHLEHQRYRYRGTFNTNRISDMVAYIQRRAGTLDNPPAVFVADSNAVAFFNLGTIDDPGHGDDIATLQLGKTAPYAALIAMDGHPHSQRAMAEWLEDWAPYLAPTQPDAGADADSERVTLAAAIAAIRDITVTANSARDSRVGDFGAGQSALDMIEASSAKKLPAGFTFRCTPFPGLGERVFHLRLSVITGERAPALKLRVVGLADAMEQIAQELETVLRQHLDVTACDIYRGVFTP